MTSTSNDPSEIPSRGPEDAHQLGLLLDAAQDMLGEEIRRTDRLEARARHMSTAAGALFAVVMATTAGVLNALLSSTNDDLDGWVVPWVGGLAIVSIVSLFVALAWTARVQRLRETNALSPDSIDGYIEWAEKGHVAVAKYLIQSYASSLRKRRAANEKRAKDLNNSATAASACAVVASLLQLTSVFIALLTH